MDPRNYLANAGATPPAKPASPSVGYPQSATPGVTPATTPGPFWFYKVGEELRGIIVGAGLTPDDSDLTQVLTALEALYLNQSEGDARYQRLSVGGPLRGAFSNLAVSTTGLDSNIPITADELVVESASNEYRTLRNVNVTIDSSTVGANGLDAGTLAGSTWYYTFIIWNGSTVAGLMSASATAPTLPSGYTHWARVGAIRTDGGANKYPLPIQQKGKKVSYIPASSTNLTGLPTVASGSANGSTPSVSAFVPPTAESIMLTLKVSPSSNAGSAYVGVNANASDLIGFSSGGSTPAHEKYVEILLTNAMTIYYDSTSLGSSNLKAIGWTDNL